MVTEAPTDERPVGAAARALRVLMWGAVGAAAAAVFGWVALAAIRIYYPFGIDYFEGGMLGAARDVAQGRTLYPAVDALPHCRVLYGPVYLLAWAPFAWASGPPFWPGRLIAAVAALAAAWLIGVLAAREAGRRWVGLVAAGLFLGSLPVMQWAGIARVDTLAVAFALGGLALATSDHRTHRAAAVVLFVCAVFTKQSAIAAPLAAAIWLTMQGRRREGLVGLAAFVALAGAVMGALVWSTGGGAWREMVVATQTRWQLSYMMLSVAPWARRSAPLLCLAGVGLLDAARGRRVRPCHLYLLILICLVPPIGRRGAGMYYLIELSGALAIVAAAYLGRVVARPRATLVAALVICAVIAQLALTSRTLQHELGLSSADPREEAQALTSTIASFPGPVLSEDLGAAALAGKVLWLDPCANFEMAEVGIWDPAPLIDLITRKAFDAIVIRASSMTIAPQDSRNLNYWSASELDAVRTAYVQSKTVSGFIIFVPRPGARRGVDDATTANGRAPHA